MQVRPKRPSIELNSGAVGATRSTVTDRFDATDHTRTRIRQTEALPDTTGRNICDSKTYVITQL